MANNEEINNLINGLSQRLNAEPDQIKAAVEKGNLDSVLKGMNSSQAAKIQSILADPEASQKILSTPQAQALIKKLMG